MSPRRKRKLLITAGLAVAYAAGTVIAVRQGYSLGRNGIVRCQKGHLFSTVWIPGGSLKAIRLGPWRVQWCPVGHHVAIVHPVKTANLSESEREFAVAHHDVRVP